MSQAPLAHLGGALVVSVWVTAAMGAWAVLALWTARRSGAALRHRLALGCLLTMAATPPLVWFVVPAGEVSWLRWCGVLWLVGTTVGSVRLIVDITVVRRLRQRAELAADAAQQRLQALSTLMGITRRITLGVSDQLDVPCTVGALAPTVLVPRRLSTTIADGGLDAVLLHELAHVARRDYAWHVAQLAATSVLFFHPVAWWLSGIADREREAACDARAGAIVGAEALARALASLEAGRGGQRPERGTNQELLSRVSHLVQPRARQIGASDRRAVPLVLVTSGMATAVALGWLGTMVPEMTSPALWSTAIGLGLLVGLRHAFEPDHLMAVATMVSRERSSTGAFRLGASWGFGHTLALFAMVAALSAARRTIPDAVGHLLELGVAAMIAWMGLRAILAARRLGQGGPVQRHHHGLLEHRHAAGGAHLHVGPFALARGPLAVGAVHGLAGSGALTALATASLPTLPEQLAFALVFGLGSTLGMAVVSGLAGWPLARVASSTRAVAAISGATGVAAVLFAMAWAGPLVRELLP